MNKKKINNQECNKTESTALDYIEIYKRLKKHPIGVWRYSDIPERALTRSEGAHFDEKLVEQILLESLHLGILTELEQQQVENEHKLLSQPSNCARQIEASEIAALSKTILDLRNRCGLTWSMQPEELIKILSGTQVILGGNKYTAQGARVKANSEKGKNIPIITKSGQELEAKRISSESYQYIITTPQKEHASDAVIIGDIVYEALNDSNPHETYIPVLNLKDGITQILDAQGLQRHNLIEAENFYALQVLTHTHRSKIDVIYIDPPYNTGNKDFQYNDSFVEKDDGARHSKWMSFIHRRLKLCKQLLSPDGTILISIDENEYSRLKLICDQIFGEDKHATTLHIQMSGTQGPKVLNAKKGSIVKNAEYVLIYSNQTTFRSAKVFSDPRDYDKHYSNWIDKSGAIRGLGEEILTNHPSLQKALEAAGIAQKGKEISNDNLISAYRLETFREFAHNNSENIIRYHDAGAAKIPANVIQKCKQDFGIKFVSENRSYILTKNSKGNLQQCIPLTEKIVTCDDFHTTTGISTIRGDWWPGFYLDQGNVSKEGRTLFPNAKKPVRLIKQLIQLATAKADAIVLDFFAGSGTTGHAVMAINSETNSNMSCILVTNNEGNICEDKCFQRIKNSIEDDKYDAGWKYLKLIHKAASSINFEDISGTFDSCSEIQHLRFNAGRTIQRTADWLITDTFAALFNIDCFADFKKQLLGTERHLAFVGYDENEYKLFLKKIRALKIFSHLTDKDIHHLSKEYLDDLFFLITQEPN